ncbi:LysR family transcriptional regulator [Clostridiales bacterium TF09-2AC]|nr:LysR family transcriptional regulator [Clostridiales bacterium TF09-2AC]
MTQQGIEVFLAVAKTGSISAAAQALYITQPAVSRHLRSLEADLDCTLFIRGRGKRQVELTPQGRDFIPVAEKWRLLWQEAKEATNPSRTRVLRVASVGSLSTYLLPPVFRTFLAHGRNITFHNYHSREAYDYIAQGLVDIALISDHMYHPQVETVPAFRSHMTLVTGPGLPWPDRVHPSQLDPAKELRMPWNPEYDLWHSFWFSTAAVSRATLDQMSLLEEFFSWQDGWADSWAIVPAVAAVPLSQKLGLTIRALDNGPADETIYYLQGPQRDTNLTAVFLTCLDCELKNRPEVDSLLQEQHTSISEDFML